MKQARNYILCLNFALCLIFFQSVKAQVNAPDSPALVAFYNRTNGSNWTNKINWLTSSVKTWYGVTVSKGRVTNPNIYSNNLIRTLLTELGNLTALKYL